MKNMNRLSLIAAICAKRNVSAKVEAVLLPTKHDKREEIALNVSQDDKATHRGEDLQDADLPVLNSRLAFDSVRNTREKESDYILSREERAQLARERLAYRVSQDLSAPVNPLALALVA